jgi:hypothetical protein
VLSCSWLLQHANYVCWTVSDCFSNMQILCAELFLIVADCELCVMKCSWFFQHPNYVWWTVPDGYSMRIMCGELFLIVSACELCVLNCSWLFQHANYVCWTVPVCFRMQTMCADLLINVFQRSVFYLGIELLLSCFVQFYSILFYSILFYSILFYSILFYSILFYSILFWTINWLFQPQRVINRAENHTKRQATQHGCLPSLLGDGNKKIEIVYGGWGKYFVKGRLEQPRQKKSLVTAWLAQWTYQGRTPSSFVLFQSPFTSFQQSAGATPL